MKRVRPTKSIRNLKANLYVQEKKVVKDVINKALSNTMFAIGTFGVHYDIRTFS